MQAQRYVLGLHEIDRTQVALAGGKGANLGELARIDGVRVPPGFCVTTDAYRRDGAIPDDVAAAITGALGALGEQTAYAVRSSATAEDLPTASFAGQHDTYLDVVGRDAILEHVRRCWASLSSERAVAYRRRNGVGDEKVRMAVVVQQMVAPRSSGVLFTADPLTSNRKVASVEAGLGLGEALVSGLVEPDSYKVRDDRILTRSVAGEQAALTDAEVVQLVRLGRRIEAHFGCPQDIEWCLTEAGFEIVQSRPITTLFPIPDAGDDENRVYVSVGHQQMMTDAMKPLGISLFQLTARPRMLEAGGRLFVDVTERLASPASRAALLALWRSDPLIGDALQAIAEREDFLASPPDEAPGGPPAGGAPAPIETDPAIVAELIQRSEASIAALERDIRGRSGTDLIDFILADIQELRRVLFDPLSTQVIMAGMQATWWLNEHVEAADTLLQSVPHNVTSEMGLALLDVADAIRPHPDLVALLEGVEEEDQDFLDELPELRAYLDRYGMRCAGEIDITRPRWSERPSMLVPALLSNIRNFEPGEARRRFEQGRQEALAKKREVLERSNSEEAERMIDRARTFAGYREYPKYFIVRRYFVYKRALLEEAARLVRAGVLREPQDIYYLTLPELSAGAMDDQVVAQRRQAFSSHQSLTPPRVLTSEGEVVAGAYRRDGLPGNALIGLPVSRGTIEGRARVVLDIAEAELEPGDILVTAYTDPSWSPLFVAVDGLVTEVGGLMTHGSVIAREYGLPAVVGVQDATRLIRDGQRIRVHGTDGYVELLA